MPILRLVKAASRKEARTCCLVETRAALLIRLACDILKENLDQDISHPRKTKQENVTIMKHINQIFFKGLIVVLPITLTFYLLFWASVNIESLFASGLRYLLGQELYIPGLGIVLTIVFIFLVGLLVTNYITRPIFAWLTQLLEKIPLIKVIYNPLKDLMALIPGRSSSKDKPQRVVMVQLDQLGVECMGLVTREDLEELGTSGESKMSVYIPFSYMLGGMTVIVPRERVKIVDLPVDQALKLSVTAWIKASDSKGD
jgi:uncharacterized membrane protein